MTEPTFQVEVTIAGFVMNPDGTVLGDNIADGTIAFGCRIGNVPPEPSDAEVNAQIAKALAPVFATVRLALTGMGFAFIGDIEERTLDHAHQVGTGMTPEMLVALPVPQPREARA